MPNVGFRIFKRINRPDKELIAKFTGLPVANIADEMNRVNCMDAHIKPLTGKPLLGCAFTVKARISDNLMFHKALDMAQPGDVIVVDGRGDLTNALTGEIMMRQAEKKGLAGIVIDGAVRDAEALKKLDLAIYAAGITPQGPYKDGPGEINVPVCCGGVTVQPGDILVGDSDGIVVISPKDAAAIAEKALLKSQKEQTVFKAIEAGTVDRSMYSDEAFIKRGCEIIDDYWK